MSDARKISGLRLFAGFAAGVVVPLAAFSFLLWPSWQAVLIIGVFFAALLLLVIGMPAFIVLRRFGLINIYAAILLGGILCALPVYYFSFYNALTTHSMTRDDAQLIIDGRLTLQGFLHLFVYDPLWLFVPGAVGGLVGWLVAAGFRTRAS